MSIAAQDGFDLEFASEELRAERQVVLAAVKQFGNALEYASKELRADREIVLAAVKRNGWALRFASKELRADRQFVLAAVKAGGDALQFASVELRADRYMVKFAMKCTRPQKLWKLLTVRFFVILFVKKLQHRVEESERVDFEEAWEANRGYLVVGVSEKTAKAIFHRGWEEKGAKRQCRRDGVGQVALYRQCNRHVSVM